MSDPSRSVRQRLHVEVIAHGALGNQLESERNFDAGYKGFLEQAEGSAVQVLLSTARRPLRERAAALAAERSIAFQHFDRLDSAVAHSLERAGHLLMRRS